MPVKTWIAMLIVMPVGVAMGVAGAPHWAVSITALLLGGVLLLPRRIGERSLEPGREAQMARALMMPFLPLVVIVTVASIVAGRVWVAIAVVSGAGVLFALTRSDGA